MKILISFVVNECLVTSSSEHRVCLVEEQCTNWESQRAMNIEALA